MDIREVKIEEYWPLIVKGTEEFGQIAVAENPEFNLLAENVYNVLKDSFIKEATEYGVSRWEKMLGLTVTDNMTLDDRKAAILTYLSVKIPYTWRVLKQMLTGLLGEDNFEMSIDNDTQTLKIELASTVTHMRGKIDELCDRVIPQNLLVEVDGIPIDYTPVEYLESYGTQRIDIPCQPTDNTGFYTDYENLSNAPYQHVLSCSADGSTLIFTPHYNGTGYYFFAAKVLADNVTRWNMSGITLLARKVVTFNYLNSKSCEIDGVRKYDIPDNLKSYNLAETCLFMYPSSKNQNEGLVGRMYEARVSEGSEIVARYLPCIDPIGAPCMFDIVTRTPFYNSGTGDFTYPKMEQQATTYSLRRRDYAQMTEHGIRRLYHVPNGCNLSKDEYAERNGFKILVETPQPEEGYWMPVWHEHEDCIELEWVEAEAPLEEETI